jgi:hypothetical protein
MEAPPLVPTPSTKKREQGAKAPQKTSARRAPCSTSIRGRGRGSANAMADRVVLDVETGTSDELPLMIRQSFKDGRYSPLTGMEEIERQIMLEQFIASGVVVKDEIINIDSD